MGIHYLFIPMEIEETAVKFIASNKGVVLKKKVDDYHTEHNGNTITILYDEEIPSYNEMELIPYNSLFIRIPQIIAGVILLLGLFANFYLKDFITYKKYINKEISFLILITEIVPFNIFLIISYAALLYLLTMTLRYSNYIL